MQEKDVWIETQANYLVYEDKFLNPEFNCTVTKIRQRRP